MSSRGPQLGMGLQMGLDITIKPELEAPDKEALENALRLWLEKPHQEIAFPIRVLKDALSGGKPIPGNITGKLAMHEGEIREEFAMLNSAEMRKIDPKETVGIFIGESVFISDTTPEAYVPLVALNLGLLRRINDENPLSEMIKASGVDMDTSRHWSANVVDILIAEKYFGEDRSAFMEYLKWRKQIERTEFFQNELIGQVFKEKLQSLRYRRTTHPKDRGRYGKKSWNMAGTFDDLGAEFADVNASSFGVTKADIIIRRLANETSFSPEHMQRLVDFIEANNQMRKVDGGRERKGVLVTDPKLDTQAYLLTEDCSGGSAILEQGKEHNYYHFEASALRSLAALKDRIAFFFRKALQAKSTVSPALLKFIQTTPSMSLDGLKDKEITIDLTGTASFSDASVMVAKEIELIDAKLKQVAELLAKYDELERDLGQMGDVNIVPGNITAEKENVLRVKTILDEKREKLTASLDTVRRIFEVRQDHKALLSSAVLDS